MLLARSLRALESAPRRVAGRLRASGASSVDSCRDGALTRTSSSARGSFQRLTRCGMLTLGERR